MFKKIRYTSIVLHLKIRVKKILEAKEIGNQFLGNEGVAKAASGINSFMREATGQSFDIESWIKTIPEVTKMGNQSFDENVAKVASGVGRLMEEAIWQTFDVEHWIKIIKEKIRQRTQFNIVITFL